MGSIKDRNGMDQQKQKILRRGGNYLFNSLSLKYSVITRAIEPPTVHLSLMQILRDFSTGLDGKESV